MPCTLKNNSFVGGAYLTKEGKCRCGLFPFEHPEPPQQLGLPVAWQSRDVAAAALVPGNY